MSVLLLLVELALSMCEGTREGTCGLGMRLLALSMCEGECGLGMCVCFVFGVWDPCRSRVVVVG